MVAYEDKGTGYCQIAGTLHNNTPRTIKAMSVKFHCYDASRRRLPHWPSDLWFQFYRDHLPHETTPFATTLNDIRDSKRLDDIHSISVQMIDLTYK